MKKNYYLIAALIVEIFFTQIKLYSSPGTLETPNTNFIYLSPVPESKLNPTVTNIIIRSKFTLDNNSITNNVILVKGAESGNHPGKIILADDGKTILFQPDIPFNKGEVVSVELRDGLLASNGSKLGKLSFNFFVTPQNRSNIDYKTVIDKEIALSNQASQNSSIMKSINAPQTILKLTGGFLPSTFPQTTLFSTNPSPGQIFLSNFSNDPQYADKDFLLILNNDAQPFFYKKTNGYSFGLTLQPDGNISYYNAGKNYFFFIMDPSFQVIDSVKCGNGYQTDVHELRTLPNGHYLLIGAEIQVIDMSKIVEGGNPNANVTGIIIQELDKDKNVVFQWRSWDHFKITDAIGIDLTAATIDYVHTNAIELDADGNILISNRHMSEITKIDRQTGDIIWRWGGKNNQFTFINDSVGFSYQHALRRIANGNFTLFDNGNLHTSVLPSRAVEYKLDEKNMTAELVWQYVNQPSEISMAMGYVQRLGNGNTLVGWGMGNPTVTEVTPSGEKVFELSLPENVYSYRAFRFNLDKQYYTSFVPQLLYPEDKTSIGTATTPLTWKRNRLANTFHLQVSADSSFNKILVDLDNITDTSFSIRLIAGTTYFWHVAANNNSDEIGGYSGFSDTKSFRTSDIVAVNESQLPTSFSLSQNYPNPFNPATTIKYDLPRTAMVQINIYNILGQEISKLVDGVKPAGFYSTVFNANNLPSGLYIYQIIATDPNSGNSSSFVQTKKMLLIK